MKRILPIAVIVLALASAPVFAEVPALLVSAAASLTDVLSGLKAEAEKAVGCPIQFNFAGSGTLRKQIAEGAPVDVFFSAAAEDMNLLESAKLLAPGTRKDLLSNAIVLIGDDSYPDVTDPTALRKPLADVKVFAIGNPASVPAGRYAVEALKNLGLYPLVEGKLALGGSVREVLQFVQSGAAPLGVVFTTDALTLKPGSGVKIIYHFPNSALANPVVYPIAVVGGSKKQDAAAKFIAFLQTKTAELAFSKAGFVKP